MATCYATKRKYTTCSVKIYVTIYGKMPWEAFTFEWEMAIRGKTFVLAFL